VVEVAEMRDLMRDNETPDRGRRHDESPAQANPPLGRATSPPGAGIADGNRGGGDAGALRIFGNLDRKQVAGAGPKVKLDAALKAGRIAADVKFVAEDNARAGHRGGSNQADVAAFEGNYRPGQERLVGLAPGELGVNPFALLDRPADCGPAAGPRRASELEDAARAVEAQAHPPGAPDRPDL